MFPAVALIPLNASAAMSVRDEHPENIEVNVFVLVVAPNRPAGTFWRAVQFWKQLSAVVTLILWAKSLSGIAQKGNKPDAGYLVLWYAGFIYSWNAGMASGFFKL